jgi:hypothetical protein
VAVVDLLRSALYGFLKYGIQFSGILNHVEDWYSHVCSAGRKGTDKDRHKSYKQFSTSALAAPSATIWR